MTLSPKQQFAKLQDDHKAYALIARSDAFQNACAFSMAEYALANPTTENMEGARKFLGVLINLAEKPEPAPRYPIKTIQPPQ